MRKMRWCRSQIYLADTVDISTRDYGLTVAIVLSLWVRVAKMLKDSVRLAPPMRIRGGNATRNQDPNWVNPLEVGWLYGCRQGNVFSQACDVTSTQDRSVGSIYFHFRLLIRRKETRSVINMGAIIALPSWKTCNHMTSITLGAKMANSGEQHPRIPISLSDASCTI